MGDEEYYNDNQDYYDMRNAAENEMDSMQGELDRIYAVIVKKDAEIKQLKADKAKHEIWAHAIEADQKRRILEALAKWYAENYKGGSIKSWNTLMDRIKEID